MKSHFRFTRGADQDLDYFEVREQKIILDAVEKYLRNDANVESKRRKRLRPNPLAPWELKIGNIRVFYELGDEGLVRVLAVGHKLHNELFIRGRRIEL